MTIALLILAQLESVEEVPIGIDPLENMPGLPPWILVTTGLLIAILAALIVWLFLKNRKQGAAPKESPLQRAHQRLAILAEEKDERSLALIATELSLTLRTFLAEAERERALYQTREERLDSADYLQSVPPSLREDFNTFFEELSATQYASPRSDSEAAATFLERSRELLNQFSAARLITSTLDAER